MKRILALFIIVLLLPLGASAAPLLNFKISKPLCLLVFLETAAGDPHGSVTLRDYISANIAEEDTAAFRQTVRKFAMLNMDSKYTLSQYPPQRQKPRSSANLIKIAAIQSDNLQDFFDRITGVLPNEQLLQLKEVFIEADVFYDKIIFRKTKTALERRLAELKLYNDKTKYAFLRFKTFYGSTWPDNMPFTVAIYPIPAATGNVIATPHNNSLTLAVLTEQHDHENRMGVIMHEICHVLYEQQPLALQWKLDSAFAEDTSLVAQYAYTYLDEALATACGNGWMVEHLAGKPNKDNWYNDEYINAYAHALYPMVKGYVENFRTIDKRFIASAISIFEQKFPGAALEYNNIFNRMNIYTDAASNEQYRSIMNILEGYYRISGSYSSYPITDPQSLSLASTSLSTQLFIIHTDHKANFSALKQLFPELSEAEEGGEGIISFIDSNKRPIVIVNVKGLARIEAAFKKMTETKKISRSLSLVSIN